MKNREHSTLLPCPALLLLALCKCDIIIAFLKILESLFSVKCFKLKTSKVDHERPLYDVWHARIVTKDLKLVSLGFHQNAAGYFGVLSSKLTTKYNFWLNLHQNFHRSMKKRVPYSK